MNLGHQNSALRKNRSSILHRISYQGGHQGEWGLASSSLTSPMDASSQSTAILASMPSSDDASLSSSSMSSDIASNDDSSGI